LTVALQWCNLEVLEYFVAHGADINSVFLSDKFAVWDDIEHDSVTTLLHVCCHGIHYNRMGPGDTLAVVRYLVEHGLDVNYVSSLVSQPAYCSTCTVNNSYPSI
jgi:hypothetical protein